LKKDFAGLFASAPPPPAQVFLDYAPDCLDDEIARGILFQLYKGSRASSFQEQV
jgi:hypothetical protein